MTSCLKHVIALGLGCLDVSIVSNLIIGVKVNQLTFLVGLVAFDEILILFDGVVVALTVLDEGNGLNLVKELLIKQHTILDEDLEVVPFVFELLTIGIEDFYKTIGNLLGDVARNLLDVAVGLQIRTAYVERDVG